MRLRRTLYDMLTLLMILWIVLGLLGLQIFIALPPKEKVPPGSVWLAIWGPIFLVIVLVISVCMAVESKS